MTTLPLTNHVYLPDLPGPSGPGFFRSGGPVGTQDQQYNAEANARDHPLDHVELGAQRRDRGLDILPGGDLIPHGVRQSLRQSLRRAGRLLLAKTSLLQLAGEFQRIKRNSAHGYPIAVDEMDRHDRFYTPLRDESSQLTGAHPPESVAA